MKAETESKASKRSNCSSFMVVVKLRLSGSSCRHQDSDWVAWYLGYLYIHPFPKTILLMSLVETWDLLNKVNMRRHKWRFIPTWPENFTSVLKLKFKKKSLHFRSWPPPKKSRNHNKVKHFPYQSRIHWIIICNFHLHTVSELWVWPLQALAKLLACTWNNSAKKLALTIIRAVRKQTQVD